MRGGILLFRGSGLDARRYVEVSRSRADDYYLTDSNAVATRFVCQNMGGKKRDFIDELSPSEYQNWVDWKDPKTGEKRGKVRESCVAVYPNGRLVERKSSPLFAELTINVPKSLSVAAAIHEEISYALDLAQKEAAFAMRDYLFENSVALCGTRGRRYFAHAEQLEITSIRHLTSRAGDPHRHLHFQISTRIFAEGKWRALDTAVLFRQQAALRRLGETTISTNYFLHRTLAKYGYRLNSVTGEVLELEPFNQVMSKRNQQVREAFSELLTQWKEEHPGEEPGVDVINRLDFAAWNKARPSKKNKLYSNTDWLNEIVNNGLYIPSRVDNEPVDLEFKSVDLEEFCQHRGLIINRVLQLLSARMSAWNEADIYGACLEIIRSIRDYSLLDTASVMKIADISKKWVVDNSIVAISSEYLEHAKDGFHKYMTSDIVLQEEAELGISLANRAPSKYVRSDEELDLLVAWGQRKAQINSLDDSQKLAVKAIFQPDPMVIIEGAAGAGKTTLLRVVKQISRLENQNLRVFTPTLKAAQVASNELGTSANSLAKLLHSYGVRWDKNGVYYRLAPGQSDINGCYNGIDSEYRLQANDIVLVDEAGMVNQTEAKYLIDILDEVGAKIVFVGDRAQLPAVGRGGVLDAAAKIYPPVDLDEVHRFSDPVYSDITLRIRKYDYRAIEDIYNYGSVVAVSQSKDIEKVFAHELTKQYLEGKIPLGIVATNEQAKKVNEIVQKYIIANHKIYPTYGISLMDEQIAYLGDRIQIRRNDKRLGIANREIYTIESYHRTLTCSKSVIVVSDKGVRKIIPLDYLKDNATLAYALTAHGVQGETVNEAFYLANESASAQNLYVGLTRGKHKNAVFVSADDKNTAIARLQESLAQNQNMDKGVISMIERSEQQIHEKYMSTKEEEILRSPTTSGNNKFFDSFMEDTQISSDSYNDFSL